MKIANANAAAYQFHLDDFTLSESGVHLLRHEFNFKTIAYPEIRKAVISDAAEIKNASVVFAFGILLICFSFYQGRWVIERLFDPQVYHIYIESIVVPIIPAFLGIYCIYVSIKKARVLKLKTGDGTYRLKLHSLVKSKQIFAFENYLRGYLGERLIVCEARKGR